MKSSQAWVVFLCAGFTGALIYFLLPRGGVAQAGVYILLHVATCVALVAGIALHRPGRGSVWPVLLGSQVLYVVGSVWWYLYPTLSGVTLSSPNPSDAAFIGAYTLEIIALTRLVRARTAERSRADLIDVTIAALGLATLLWVFQVSRSLNGSTVGGFGQVVTVAYPMFDLVLLAIILRLVALRGHKGASFWLVAAAVMCQLAADIGYSQTTLRGGSFFGSPILAGNMMLFACLGAAALHPSMRMLVTPADGSRRSTLRGRLPFLAVASLLGPAVLVIQHLRGAELHVLVIMMVTAAMFLLILARVSDLMVDLSEHQRALDELAVYEAVVESTDEAIIVTAPDDTIVAWNGGAERLYGYSAAEAIGQNIALIRSPDSVEHLPAILEALHSVHHTQVEAVEIRKDGSEVHVAVTLSPVRTDSGPAGLVGIARDITDQKRKMEREREQAAQLAHMAFHDPLTGLANRALLNERLTDTLAARQGEPVGLLLLDLDDFKSVNDVSGHATGDQVLVEVARRLATCVRAADTVARFGGDEFAIVVVDGDADRLAQRVLEALERPVQVEDRAVVLGASIGVAASDGIAGADLLILQADVAMYVAKGAGKGRVQHFDPAMADVVRRRADLHDQLRQAVSRGEIVVHYQPIVDVQTQSMSRMEALVRWQRPDRLVPPVEFLPLAEETGLIVGIGQEVLRQTCEQLHDWLAEDERRSVAVNVSAWQLAQESFAADVLQVLASAGVRPAQLVLEVTETLFLDPSRGLIDRLVALRARGVRVSIDDFGTGYSSLGRLQALPVDSLKIDRSFVDLIRTGDEDLPILTSMILMSHSLGLDVTAEGVETREQAQRLLALGCDYLQGYLFARPQPTRAALTSAADQAMAAFSAIVGSHAGESFVVVIEDDDAARDVVRLTLTAAGLAVEEARTGAEGLALAGCFAPDCILVDLGLPDMDGLDVVRALRTRPDLASTAIVVLTGAAHRDVKAAAFTAGADDYIVKPIMPKHLPARVRGAIAVARRAPAGARHDGSTPGPATDPRRPGWPAGVAVGVGAADLSED